MEYINLKRKSVVVKDGDNYRCYENNPSGREQLRQNVPAQLLMKIMDVWGDTPALSDPEPEIVEPIEPVPDYFAFLRGLMGVES